MKNRAKKKIAIASANPLRCSYKSLCKLVNTIHEKYELDMTVDNYELSRIMEEIIPSDYPYLIKRERNLTHHL